MKYVSGIPKKLPKGGVLVHNHVFPPQKHLGLNGFRAWTQKADKRLLVVCRCKWAGVDLHGLTHYRVSPKLLARSPRLLIEFAGAP
jgi:hypothetical protein